MFTVYFGGDALGVRTKAFDDLRRLEERGVAVERITADRFFPGMFTDIAGATSLFTGPQAYLIDTMSENAEAFESLLQSITVLTESANTCVAIEGALTADTRKLFTNAGATCIEVKGEKKETFNPFQLSDALLARDKRTLWFLLQAATRENVGAENLIGTLFWQLKTLRLAGKTKSAAEAGMKDFPYQKAKRALSKFKKGELEALSESLLAIYHDGHNGTRDINIALERWALEL